MVRFKDATGKKFGKLTAIERVGNNKDGCSLWRCKCDCGKESIVMYSSLSTGNTKSCGCVTLEKATTHGKSRSKIYASWQAMKTRCDNPKAVNYLNYGGKGITYTPEWYIFENFYNDMGKDFIDGYTLERTNNLGNYTKDNCIWASYITQNNNRKCNIHIMYNDKRFTPKEASVEFSIPLSTIYNRRRRGWEDKRIIEEPVHIEF